MTHPGTTCEFAHLDGVYVLGALAAGERAAYERHLPGCAECTRALRDLAGIPGLLGRVQLETVEQLQPAEPVPATLLPAMAAEVRRVRRRRRVAVGSFVAAAAVLLVLLAVGIGTTLGEDPQPQQQVAAAQRMEALGTPSSGWVSLTQRRWGTQIDLTCTYEGPVSGPATYVLVVTATDGRTEQVGTWRTADGQEVHVTMATDVTPDDIASVEVRTASGYSVLRLAR
ncbi:zf-HC2 domain-containing protein [Nocardioides sp. QY071]|uniref:anti-sigma factor family protein n=1 Tax=Nocardioides sp. QY071 TaxID=3044187 RepID=UPI00249ABB07|nr:zf-HC2 domain-containing protein [Nocardioides sp. QY071]WGY00962.1 zf-HC2 domain-containing protein [Nocardioides sp. QY071]